MSFSREFKGDKSHSRNMQIRQIRVVRYISCRDIYEVDSGPANMGNLDACENTARDCLQVHFDWLC